MKFQLTRRASLLMAIGAMLLSSASCVTIDEQLGENLIPTHQHWDVFTPKAKPFENIELKASDSLSAYSSRRISFGATKDEVLGSCNKVTSFTLVPLDRHIDLGENTKVRQFHFSAVRDTLSTVNDNQQRMMQNIYVYGLKKPLDSTILYTNSLAEGVLTHDKLETNQERFLDLSKLISKGVPVYNGSDSLSFDFTTEYSEALIAGIKEFKKICIEKKDTLLADYLNEVPGLYIETETPAGIGGRINMFDIALEFDQSGYISGNYAELKITADYGERKDVDTSFLFIYGPAGFVENISNIPTQIAFNGSSHTWNDGKNYLTGVAATDKLIVEGGSGVKPVISAKEIRSLVNSMIEEAAIEKGLDQINPKEVVINKASIILPYDVGGDWDKINKFPTILSPTVKLHGVDDNKNKYVSYAGLTDASIESENQGDINRSLSHYSPDISHHVQEIIKLEKEAGETDADFEKRMMKYDIWMLIMHEEVTVTTSAGNNNDYYNNLLYNSYYNNMMYDPYGYGGYGYGGYGYGGYGYGGYGYGNYYNYMMMASYMNSGSNSSESISTDLDKDRYYNCSLGGPTATDEALKPKLKITFSAPKTAEKTE